MALLCACGTDVTRVELTITSDATLQVDDYQLRIATPAIARSARADVQSSLELVLPDAMAGEQTTIEVWGLAVGRQVGYGIATMTPVLHGTAAATVVLQSVSCDLWCEAGATACMDDGITTCAQSASGCFAWSAPMPCSAETPFCSNGTCAASCMDECSASSSTCDTASTVRTCGQFDADTCLDWSPAMACPGGESCSAGVCGETMTCSGDGADCDDGNKCTTSDTCEGGACSGTPKCTTAPPHADPTCASDGTCGFACRPGYTKSGATCEPTIPAQMPTPRAIFSAVAVNGRIYLVGGENEAGYPTSLDVYDVATNTWSAKKPMSTAREGAAAASVNGHLYAIGGVKWDDVPLVEKDVNEDYAIATDAWATRAKLPSGRNGHAAATGADGNIYVFGGGATVSEKLDIVQAYNPPTNMWLSRPSMPTARSGLVAVAASDGLIYVIGGKLPSGSTGANEAYDPVAGTWTARAPMPTARYGMGAAELNGRIYVGGGNNASGAFATMQVYTIASNSWTTLTPMPGARGALAAAAGSDGRIYFFGGYSGAPAVTTVQAYDPLTDTWH